MVCIANYNDKQEVIGCTREDGVNGGLGFLKDCEDLGLEITYKTQSELDADQQQKALSDAKIYFTNEVQKHIDEARAVFNTTNMVSFESLANMDSASNRVGYSKQAECKVFVDWAYITVWDTMRTWQATLTAIPTEEEFRAKLATVAYNG